MVTWAQAQNKRVDERTQAFRREQIRLMQQQLDRLQQQVTNLQAQLHQVMVVRGTIVEPQDERPIQEGVYEYGNATGVEESVRSQRVP